MKLESCNCPSILLVSFLITSAHHDSLSYTNIFNIWW